MKFIFLIVLLFTLPVSHAQEAPSFRRLAEGDRKRDQFAEFLAELVSQTVDVITVVGAIFVGIFQAGQ